MWRKLRNPLLALSLGLNLAFVAMWLASSLARNSGQDISGASDGTGAVSITLHRDIGVTAEQWHKIEPMLQDFREKASNQRRKINILRAQLMDLLALPEVDEAAIRAKQKEILSNQRQMQDLVIGHLLKEKEILSPEQARSLMQALCKQCSEKGGMVPGKGIGGILTNQSGGVPEEEE